MRQGIRGSCRWLREPGVTRSWGQGLHYGTLITHPQLKNNPNSIHAQAWGQVLHYDTLITYPQLKSNPNSLQVLLD